MNGRRLRHIEELADKVLHDAMIQSAPIPVDKIARLHGIVISNYNLGADVSGVLVLKEGRATIGLNISDSQVRRRFTIAHELGHFFLEHQRGGLFVDNHKKNFTVMFRDVQSSTGEVLQEQEANAFAAALLMPRNLLELWIKKCNFDLTDESDLKTLASKFKVSSQAMAIRIANLGLF
jgi:Zn-dependent peptidase ImmA (M78 family)